MKLACELPDAVGRSLSTWTCAELARTLKQGGIVETISPQSVQRILSSHKLKPWRVHHWLSSKVPRDEAFRAQVVALCDLYTRPLGAHERVLSLDEKTSLQPRTRTSPTRPPLPGGTPVQLEHEYQRKGALNLLAAFDTRTGEVIGICRRRKRQVEFIELLEAIDRDTPPSTTAIHLVADNVITHKGKLVRAWLVKHPRFQFHFTPVHCSWMNQVEQWFSILARKALRRLDFDGLLALDRHIHCYIERWGRKAHPFNWTTGSVTKVLAKCEPSMTLLVAA